MERLLKMFGNKFLLISFCFLSLIGSAQEKESKWDWSKSGYLKYMQTVSWSPNADIVTDNLIHNRLNFRGYYGNRWSGTFEFRNRIFYGETVKLFNSRGINYGKQVTDYDGQLPLEILWVNENSIAMNTIADRAFINYSTNKWEIRAGRQRINWGINDTWNPNDIFNAYNFLDFDYEERPGADALRVQRYLKGQSYIDAAYKFAENRANDVFAVRYGFNRKGYDIQFISGKFKDEWTLGAGWAGSIKNAGFKGEIQTFSPYESSSDTVNVSLSATVDYSFRNGIYLSTSYMMNTTGLNESAGFDFMALRDVNAKSLMPSKHNALLATSYTFSPVFSANLSTMYGFGLNWLIVFPTLTFSIKENLNFDMVGQMFWADLPQENGEFSFKNSGNGIFARMKWNF